MTIDDKIRDEKLNYDINRGASKKSALSSGKTDKYEYLTGKEILPSNQRQIIKQAKLAYSHLGKTFEKQREKQVGALKSLKLSNKKDELKQIEGMCPKNLMNDLIRDKLKEIVNLQYVIKTDELHYKSKRRKFYNFNKYSLPIVFLGDIHEGHLLLKDSNDEESNFAAKIKNLDKGKKQLKKNFFKNNLGLLFSARKKFLNNIKSRLFRIKNLDKIPTHKPRPELATKLAKEPTKQKKSKLKLQQEFINEILTWKRKTRVTSCELRVQIKVTS